MEFLKSFSSFTDTLDFNTLLKTYNNKSYNQVTGFIVFNAAFVVMTFKGSSDVILCIK